MMNTAYSFDDVLLVPQFSSGKSRDTGDISTFLGNLQLSSPIIGANMSSVMGKEMLHTLEDNQCLGIMHRFCSVEEQIEAVGDLKEYKAASIEGSSDGIERAKKLIHEVGIDILCLDVAHAATEKTVDVVGELIQILYGLKKYVQLVIGNFATAITVSKFQYALGRKYSQYRIFNYNNPIVWKIGIGGGSMCSTRIVTGHGIPTLQSLLNFKEVSYHKEYYELIGDGGIKNSGDIVKALAAGAGTVMIGSLLAGTNETPGPFLTEVSKITLTKNIQGTIIPDVANCNKYKYYQGSASFAQKGNSRYIEGEKTRVYDKGSVVEILNQLKDGIRSGMSYCGASNLSELRINAEFIHITQSGFKESTPHGFQS